MLEAVFNFKHIYLIVITIRALLRNTEIGKKIVPGNWLPVSVFVTIGDQIKLEPGHLAKPVSFTCLHGGYTTSGSLPHTCNDTNRCSSSQNVMRFFLCRWRDCSRVHSPERGPGGDGTGSPST